jgi:nicotinate-nucleotide pyrophosphorylase (carboxylating)
MTDRLDASSYTDLVRRALAEDVGSGDITSNAIIPVESVGRAVFVAKSPLVVCGLDVAHEVFRQVDPAIRWTVAMADGDRCEPGATIGRVEGAARSILTAERTALNFLQHLSGIATLARAFAEAAAPMVVLDTRKTLPGMRYLAKYAVRSGGATNHRIGLFDAILIKDNHIRVAGGIGEAVRLARENAPAGPIEVEAQSLEEVDAALDAGADIIMLDNFSDEATHQAIARIGGRAKVELSGNMTLERVARLSTSGADYVSVGALTHSAPSADISLEINIEPGAAQA